MLAWVSKLSVQSCLAFDLKLRCRQAVLRSEVGRVSLGVRDHFQRPCRLATQDQVAQMNARQNGRSIQRA